MRSEIKKLKEMSENTMLSKSYRDAIKWALGELGESGESESKQKAKSDYPDEFEWIWAAKPEREGGNPKRQAFQKCKARIKEGATWRDLAEGVKRYRRYCDAKKITGSEKVQQMSTFFGTKESFKESWAYAADKQPANATGRKSAAEEYKEKLRSQQCDGGLGGAAGQPNGLGSNHDAGSIRQEVASSQRTAIDLEAEDWNDVSRPS